MSSTMSTPSILQSLGQTFGQIPSVIRENLKYFTYDDESDEFTCIVCDPNKIIQLSRDNQRTTTKNFMKHLKTQTHNSNALLDTEIYNRLNATFQNSIPQLIQNNLSVLGVSGDDYYCEVCKKILEVSTWPSTTEANFAQHFLTDYHESSLKTYVYQVGVLQDIYGHIPYEIYHNSQHLKLTRGQNYSCIICKTVLKVNYCDLETTEELFKNHFEDENHRSYSQQARAVSKIPLLDHIYTLNSIPWYVLENIEYLSENQNTDGALYCSLCNKSFQFSQTDLKQSELSLKQHIFSVCHETRLKERRNPEHEVYSKLHDLLDDFSDDVVNQLECLSTFKEDFFCKICNVYIQEGTSTDDLKEKIESHLCSSYHEEKLCQEMDRRANLITSLQDVFGEIPQFIEDELSHIEFKGGIDFSCTMCEKTLKSYKNGNYEENTFKTDQNFDKHFSSTQHFEYSENVNNADENLIENLASLFSPFLIPNRVLNNVENLGIDYYCYLCEVEIRANYGPKAEQLTIMNLNKHILSVDHVTKLKNKAYKKYVALSHLEFIFGGVSNLILNNIQYLEQCEDHYRCKICDKKILKGSHSGSTRKNFHSHLSGESHRSVLEYVEDNYEKARRRLINLFCIVPECLLKNLDFLSVPNDDEVYCKPCQVTLTLEDSLDNHTLEYHFESKAHELNVVIY